MSMNHSNQKQPIENTSGLKPLGRAVLTKPYEPEKKTSTIFIPHEVQDRMTQVDTRVIVIELGEHCWPDEPQRAFPGDKVMVAKFSGALIRGTADDELYRMVNDKDIYVKIVEEK